jgi:hypothetical protein
MTCPDPDLCRKGDACAGWCHTRPDTKSQLILKVSIDNGIPLADVNLAGEVKPVVEPRTQYFKEQLQ